MENKNSQVSFEYLIIFGISFLIILISFYYFSTEMIISNGEISKEQVSKIGNTLISNIEKVYFNGEGSRLTYKLKFPNNINDMYVQNVNGISVLFFNISIGDTNTLSYFYSNYDNLKFNLSPNNEIIFNSTTNITRFNKSYYYSSGIKNIKLISRGDYVEICIFTYNSNKDSC